MISLFNHSVVELEACPILGQVFLPVPAEVDVSPVLKWHRVWMVQMSDHGAALVVLQHSGKLCCIDGEDDLSGSALRSPEEVSIVSTQHWRNLTRFIEKEQ